MKRRKQPRRDQPLLPLRDTVRPASELGRDVSVFAAEARREPYPGQAELPMAIEGGERDVPTRAG